MAYLPAMTDEEMMRPGPSLAGQERPEITFYMIGILLAGERQPSGEAPHMGIDGDGILAESHG